MNKFLSFSFGRFVVLCSLLCFLCLAIYAYKSRLSMALLAKYDQYEKWQQNWEFLNNRNSQQGLPKELTSFLSEIQHLEQNDKIRHLMSIRRKVYYEDTPIYATLTPFEVLKRGKGDCDDIAYIWYHQLWRLGVPAKILVVTVNELETSFMHAVVLIESENKQPIVLDYSSFFLVAQPFEQWRQRRKAFLLFEAYGQTFKRTDSVYEASLF